jgi:anaerobic selenocysteine-containing dehydrogenase
MQVQSEIQNGEVQTLCRMCDSRCGIRVRIENGVLTDIRPAENVPVNRGRICPRSKAALQVFYHPDRLTRPLKKKRDGGFETIELARALDEIAERIQALKDAYGPQALGAWKGEAVGFQQQEAYVRRFVGALGSPNYFSNDSACFKGRDLGHRLVTGFGMQIPEFSKSGLIVLIGTNTPVCHPPFMGELADALSRGAKLVVIDPRLNPIGCLADIYAQPIPGTDGAFAWGLINQLIQKGAYDRDLVARHVVGFDRVADYAQAFTPRHVEAQSGILAAVVERSAEFLIANMPNVSVFCGAGVEHNEGGVNAVRAYVILACLCGAVDLHGNLFWAESPPLNDLCLDHVPRPNGCEPIGSKEFPVLYARAHECHTMIAMDHILGFNGYPLRGLLMTGANPAVTNPNTRKVRRAFDALDLFVVSDFFLTATAKHAHYVLPAATFLERSELHVFSKFQQIALTRRVARVGGVLDEYTLWRELAYRLGFGETYFPWPDETGVNRFLLEGTAISLADLKAHPEGIQYRPLKSRKYLTRSFPTPSGKLEFTSAYLKAQGLDELPVYRTPRYRRDCSTGFPFILTTGGRKTLLYHSCHQNIPGFREIHPEAEVELHPDDAAALKVRSGDYVRIVSKIGAIEVRARIVHHSELRRGVVEVYHGWEDRPINLVTPDAVNDPISGFPLLKGVPVKILKAESPSALHKRAVGWPPGRHTKA